MLLQGIEDLKGEDPTTAFLTFIDRINTAEYPILNDLFFLVHESISNSVDFNNLNQIIMNINDENKCILFKSILFLANQDTQFVIDAISNGLVDLLIETTKDSFTLNPKNTLYLIQLLNSMFSLMTNCTGLELTDNLFNFPNDLIIKVSSDIYLNLDEDKEDFSINMIVNCLNLIYSMFRIGISMKPEQFEEYFNILIGYTHSHNADILKSDLIGIHGMIVYKSQLVLPTLIEIGNFIELLLKLLKNQDEPIKLIVLDILIEFVSYYDHRYPAYLCEKHIFSFLEIANQPPEIQLKVIKIFRLYVRTMSMLINYLVDSDVLVQTLEIFPICSFDVKKEIFYFFCQFLNLPHAYQIVMRQNEVLLEMIDFALMLSSEDIKSLVHGIYSFLDYEQLFQNNIMVCYLQNQTNIVNQLLLFLEIDPNLNEDREFISLIDMLFVTSE